MWKSNVSCVSATRWSFWSHVGTTLSVLFPGTLPRLERRTRG
ncbi:hypothetical protein LINGRAHAP2_LOCUS34895 [Linum grandiflorum]